VIINIRNYNIMSKKLIILLLTVFSCHIYAEDDSAVTQLTQLLNNFTIMQADFTQTVTNRAGTILQEQTGVMQLKKPNLFRWQTLAPDQMLIVTDGDKIWNYDVDLAQVIIKKFGSEITDAKIASLLLGDLQKMLINFDVNIIENYNNDIANNEITVCFELNNKNFQQDDVFIKARLGFNEKQQLIMIKLYDQLNQETEFTFSKIKDTVDDSVFKFVTPEGVDVIED